MRTRILRAALTAGAIAVAAPADPALGADFSLALAGPSTGTVAQPMVLQAIGKNPPPAEWWFPMWLHADAIPAGVVSACPASSQEAMQIALSSGGQYLAFAQRENPAADGSFTHQLGFTPKQPGGWLICGYTDDGGGISVAVASLSIDVQPAAGSGAPTPGTGQPPVTVGAKPANTRAPRVTRRRGRLVCQPGEWSNASSAYTYGWRVNGKLKKGATGRTLRVTRRLRGRKVACIVTASNRAGSMTIASRAVRAR